MRTLSQHIFDLVQNSIVAGAKNIMVIVEEDILDNLIKVTIEDDGYGIKPEYISKVKNTFFTTRPKTNRHVGLGLSLLDAACKRSGGKLTIDSKYRHGTKMIFTMEYKNIDRPPLGDLPDLFTSLLLSTVENNIIWTLGHVFNGRKYRLKNRSVKDELNIFSYNEPGVRERLYRLIVEKEQVLHP
ncbi:MAG: ATP-binding protein [Thermoplasmata archaeon]